MNILFYTSTALTGGVNTVTVTLSSHFRERGHRVTRLLWHRVYGDSRDFPDGDCVYLPDRELLSEANLAFYHRILKERDIDIVINQDALYESVNLIDNHPDDEVSVISVLHSNPILNLQWLFHDIAALRNSSFREYVKRAGRILLYPKIRRQAYASRIEQFRLLEKGGSHIVVLSPGYIDTLRNYAPKLTDVTAIGNPNTYPSAAHTSKEKTVLFVGRLDNRSKKIFDLLSIWSAVRRRNASWRLLIVGEGQDEAVLREKAKNMPDIQFEGYRDPRPYYEKAAIVCMTSIFEGFPMVLTEAMQYGCVPVAYGSFPAVYDIITPGVDGEVVTPFNRKEYVRKLLHLMDEPEYRSRLAANARESVKRFDVENIVDRWEALFVKLKQG